MFFIFCFYSVFAIDINMNLDNAIEQNTVDNSIIDNENLVENTFTNTIENSNTNATINNNIDSDSSPKVSTTSATEDFELSTSDIIDIILISVCIVLILLSIAILIKIH